MTKSKAMLVNMGRGALLFGAIGMFISVCAGRICHPLHMPIVDFIVHLEKFTLIGILITAPIGVVFGLLPDGKWNPVKKINRDSENESR